jgi:hypothetical protein
MRHKAHPCGALIPFMRFAFMPLMKMANKMRKRDKQGM